MTSKHSLPQSKADVWAIPCPLATKAVILFLIDAPEDRTHTREELARAMGLHPGAVEDAIHAGQRLTPPVLARVDGAGKRLSPRNALLPNGAALRATVRQEPEAKKEPKVKKAPRLDSDPVGVDTPVKE